jgi:hypothetical protein
MKASNIPTNFRMAKGYRRKFVFLGESIRLEIVARPPRSISIRQKELKAQSSQEDYRNSLNWIQSSVEQMRAESEE